MNRFGEGDGLALDGSLQRTRLKRADRANGSEENGMKHATRSRRSAASNTGTRDWRFVRRAGRWPAKTIGLHRQCSSEPPNLETRTGGAAAAIDEVVYANVPSRVPDPLRRGTARSFRALAENSEISEERPHLQQSSKLRTGVTFYDARVLRRDVSSADRARADESTNPQKAPVRRHRFGRGRRSHHRLR